MRSQYQSPIVAFDSPSNPWPSFCVRVFIFGFLEYRQDMQKGETNLKGFVYFLGTQLDLAFASPYGALSPKWKVKYCSGMKTKHRRLKTAYNLFAQILCIEKCDNREPIQWLVASNMLVNLKHMIEIGLLLIAILIKRYQHSTRVSLRITFSITAFETSRQFKWRSYQIADENKFKKNAYLVGLLLLLHEVCLSKNSTP